jgi:hypothetical protein
MTGRTWLLLVSAAFTALSLAAILRPSSSDVASIYSADGYTKKIQNVFVPYQWLDYDERNRDAGLAVVRLSHHAHDIARSSDERTANSVELFARNSYLRQDLDPANNDVWSLDGGHIRIDPNAHNISLPLSHGDHWTGSFLYRHGEELQAVLAGPRTRNGEAVITFVPLRRELVPHDPDAATWSLFQPSPSRSGVVRLDFNYGGPAARVFLLGEDLWVRSEGSDSVGVFVENEALPRSYFRRLAPGSELKFQAGLQRQSFFSRGVTGSSGFISRYQPLANRLRSPLFERFAVNFESEMDRIVQQNNDDKVLSKDTKRHNVEALHAMVSTLDADLQSQLQTLLETFCNEGRRALGQRSFLAGTTIMNGTTGDILALASFPNTKEDAAGLHQGWERNQNFVNLPIGSVAKPLLSAAILDIWPELSTFEIPRYDAGEFDTVLGVQFSPTIDDDHSYADWIDFTTFLQHSSNKFAASLMLMALSQDPLHEDARLDAAPTALYRLQGADHARLPVLQLDAYNQLRTPSSRLKWPDELRMLFDIYVEHIEREGTQLLTDPLYDKTVWQPLLDRLQDTRFLKPWDLRSISPERVNLAINDARNLRQDYLTLIIGGSTSRWNNVKLAEAFARLVTGTRIQARLMTTPDGAKPTKPPSMIGAPTDCGTRQATGMFCPASRLVLLGGLSRVAGVYGGTAYGQVHTTLEDIARIADKHGEAIGFYSKTGTPDIADPQDTTRSQAVAQLSNDGVLRLDAHNVVTITAGGASFVVRNGSQAIAATDAIRHDPAIFQSLNSDAELVSWIVDRVRRFNGRGEHNVFTIGTGREGLRLTGIPMPRSKTHQGRAYVFYLGLYPKKAAKDGGTYEVDTSQPPIRSFTVAINLQQDWAGKKRHLGAQFGAKVLAMLKSRLWPLTEEAP